jgi:RimJ/RimL family protein N-acetyltransferase
MTQTAADAAEKPARALTADVRLPERITLDEVLLRPPTLDDVQALHEAIVESYAELHPWMPWCTEPVELADQRGFVERSLAAWENAEAMNFNVFDAEGTVIGSIGLMDRIGPGALEIGYWLRTGHTGRGVMTRAAKALTELGLGLPGIERIEIHCDAANLRSAAVPRRLGYRLDREVRTEITAPGESGLEQFWLSS